MERNTTIKVLLATEQLSEADSLLELLRKAGYKIHAEPVVNEAALRERLLQAHWDLFILFSGTTALQLTQACAALDETAQDISIICIAEPNEIDALSSVAQANCVYSPRDAWQSPAAMAQLVSRELSHAHNRRELRKMSVAHKELQQRYALLLESSSDALAYLSEGLHIYANAAYLALFGFESATQLKQYAFLDLVEEQDVALVRDHLQNFVSDEPCVFRGVNAAKSHPRLSLQCAKSSYNDEPSLQIIVRAAAGNIEQQRNDRERQSRDLLTDLLKPSAIHTRIDLAIAKGVYEQSTSAVLLLKISRFDDFALTLAKAALNLLLADVARLLQTHLPKGAAIAHFGDGEFLVILSEEATFARDEFLSELCETLNSALRQVMPESSELTFFAGLAIINELSPSASTVISRARHNMAMRTMRLGPEQQPPTKSEHKSKDMIARLNTALAQDDFLLMFQAIISLQEDGVERYELHTRLRGTDERTYPSLFLELANQHGLGERIDRWVCTQALKLLHEHNKPNLKLTIKLGHNAIASPAFLAWLQQQMQKEHVRADQLCLQISALDFISAPEQLRLFCAQLKALDLPLAITHFGCTPKPLEKLALAEATFIRLDEALLEDIDTDVERRERLGASINELHARGLLVIAPMTENAALLPLLWAANINFVQGNCLQEPSESMDFPFVHDEELTLDSFH